MTRTSSICTVHYYQETPGEFRATIIPFQAHVFSRRQHEQIDLAEPAKYRRTRPIFEANFITGPTRFSNGNDRYGSLTYEDFLVVILSLSDGPRSELLLGISYLVAFQAVSCFLVLQQDCLREKKMERRSKERKFHFYGILL